MRSHCQRELHHPGTVRLAQPVAKCTMGAGVPMLAFSYDTLICDRKQALLLQTILFLLFFLFFFLAADISL